MVIAYLGIFFIYYRFTQSSGIASKSQATNQTVLLFIGDNAPILDVIKSPYAYEEAFKINPFSLLKQNRTKNFTRSEDFI